MGIFQVHNVYSFRCTSVQFQVYKCTISGAQCVQFQVQYTGLGIATNLYFITVQIGFGCTK